jgi:DNA-binding transcriptional LysR family regulator
VLDDINELRTFVSVVAARSLSAAAQEMDLALSVVASVSRRWSAGLVRA